MSNEIGFWSSVTQLVKHFDALAGSFKRSEDISPSLSELSARTSSASTPILSRFRASSEPSSPVSPSRPEVRNETPPETAPTTPEPAAAPATPPPSHDAEPAESTTATPTTTLPPSDESTATSPHITNIIITPAEPVQIRQQQVKWKTETFMVSYHSSQPIPTGFEDFCRAYLDAAYGAATEEQKQRFGGSFYLKNNPGAGFEILKPDLTTVVVKLSEEQRPAEYSGAKNFFNYCEKGFSVSNSEESSSSWAAARAASVNSASLAARSSSLDPRTPAPEPSRSAVNRPRIRRRPPSISTGIPRNPAPTQNPASPPENISPAPKPTPVVNLEDSFLGREIKTLSASPSNPAENMLDGERLRPFASPDSSDSPSGPSRSGPEAPGVYRARPRLMLKRDLREDGEEPSPHVLAARALAAMNSALAAKNPLNAEATSSDGSNESLAPREPVVVPAPHAEEQPLVFNTENIDRNAHSHLVEGTITQYSLLGDGANPCTVIAAMVAQYMLGLQTDQMPTSEGIKQLVTAGCNAYKDRFKKNETLSYDQIQKQFTGLSPVEIPTEPNGVSFERDLANADHNAEKVQKTIGDKVYECNPIYFSVYSELLESFQQLVKSKNRPIALVLHMGNRTVPISISPIPGTDNYKIRFFDSHGDFLSLTDKAFMAPFNNTEELAILLSEKQVYTGNPERPDLDRISAFPVELAQLSQ